MTDPFEIEGVQIGIGKYYSNEYLKEIKAELQSYKGVKISRKTNHTHVYLVCANDKNCHFSLNFQVKQFWNTPYYKLVSRNINHQPTCFKYFEAQVLKRKRFLDNQFGIIKRIMTQQLQENGQVSLPKEIFQTYLREEGLKEQDIFGDPKNHHYKNIKLTVKKKFDNLVASQRQRLEGSSKRQIVQKTQAIDESSHEQDSLVKQKIRKSHKISKAEKSKAKRRKLLT